MNSIVRLLAAFGCLLAANAGLAQGSEKGFTLEELLSRQDSGSAYRRGTSRSGTLRVRTDPKYRSSLTMPRGTGTSYQDPRSRPVTAAEIRRAVTRPVYKSQSVARPTDGYRNQRSRLVKPFEINRYHDFGARRSRPVTQGEIGSGYQRRHSRSVTSSEIRAARSPLYKSRPVSSRSVSGYRKNRSRPVNARELRDGSVRLYKSRLVTRSEMSSSYQDHRSRPVNGREIRAASSSGYKSRSVTRREMTSPYKDRHSRPVNEREIRAAQQD